MLRRNCPNLERTVEIRATARRAAITRVRGGTNLNCTFQIWTIFSHLHRVSAAKILCTIITR
jgi:hypothetical protein